MLDLKTILVPVDFSAHSRRALEHAIEIATAVGAGIHLLHCYQIDPGVIAPYGVAMPVDLDRQIQEAASRAVGELADKVRSAGVEVETTLSPEHPSRAIAEIADIINAGMIVMGTRGIGGLKHVFIGSVAERTLRQAPCPVLVVRADDD